MENAPTIFLHMSNHVIVSLKGCQAYYIDDIIVYSDDWSHHIKQLSAI